jgi:hypothetical protein
LAWKFKRTDGDTAGSWEDGFSAKALRCTAAKYPRLVIGKERLRLNPKFGEEMKRSCGEHFETVDDEGPAAKEAPKVAPKETVKETPKTETVKETPKKETAGSASQKTADPATLGPVCRDASSDENGDGWGWENGASCRVMKIDDYPFCNDSRTDQDGDGWGWENGASCRVRMIDGYPVCRDARSDEDGDGWGWENNRSCKVVR